MKKRFAAFLAVAAVSMAAFGSAAYATPSASTKICSTCHDPSPSISVTAVRVSNASATTTNYQIQVTNSVNAASRGWAVYDGTTRGQSAVSAGAIVALTNGKTYTIFGCGNDALGAQIAATISVNAAPVPDTTAPTTSSDAKASYFNTATVNLSALDNAGGSGVAHTYYKLDSAAQAEGTVVTTTTVGAHTLEFWSVDASANIETPHKTANFEILADNTAPTTTSDATSTYVGTAAIHLIAADNVGGSGVAHTYYILDSGATQQGATVSSSNVGTHTLEFWSVDAAGNAEAPHNTTQFNVSASPAPTLYKYTYTFKLKGKWKKTLKAILKNKTTGKKYTVKISKKGKATWSNLPAGRYTLSTTGNARFKFKARTVVIGAV